jgi:SAM-dependent methyltransferase
VKGRECDEPPSLFSLRVAARSIYGTDATGYAAGRPDYPEKVYEILRARCGLGPGSLVLEIGAGTGLVTHRLLASGTRVIAVEPDEGMAAHLMEAIGGDLEVVVNTFEQAVLVEGRFDLAVAATSFHWVDQAVGVPKLGRILRPGGWAAMWWTIFDDPEAEDPFRDALQARLGQEDPGGQRNADFQLDGVARCNDLREMAGLENVESEIIHWTADLSSSQLGALYGSMINIRRLALGEQQQLLAHISTLADKEFGGTVRRPFVTVLYTGRRPGPPSA